MPRMITCVRCQANLSYKHYKAHLETCQGSGRFCPGCCQEINLEGSMLASHLLNCQRHWYLCAVCGEQFTTGSARSTHERSCGNARPSKRRRTSAPSHQATEQSAVDGLFKTIKILGVTDTLSVVDSLHEETDRMADILRQELEFYLSARFYLSIKLAVRQAVKDKEDEISFTTPKTDLLESTDIESEIYRQIEIIANKIDNFTRNGSGWVATGLKCVHINITKYSAMRGGTYIALPPKIKNRRCLLNLMNRDNKCLKWCVIAALHPDSSNNANRLTYYRQFESEIRDEGIDWPIPLSQIPKFEKMNNVRINVVGYDTECEAYPYYPISVSQSTDEEQPMINVLLIGNDYTTHYVLIKSLDALLRKKNTRDQMFHCVRCFHGFANHGNLIKHQSSCVRFKVQGIKFPKDEELYFNSYNKMVQTPVYIVADFEAYIKPLEENEASDLQATKKVSMHEACGFAYKVVTPFEDYQKDVVVYRDDGNGNVADMFILEMHEEYERLRNLISAEEKMIPLTPEQLQSFHTSTTCYLCQEPLSHQDRVKDHCHYTGGYLGAAHSKCNIKRSTDKRIPILFHNFKGYDVHMLIRALAEHEDDVRDITIIPNSMEKYISVQTQHFRFIDSLQHLSAPLEKLVKNLINRGTDNLKQTSEFINKEHGGSTEKFQLLTRKGVYPYSYIDEVHKFDEDLPPQSEFHNDLTNEPLSDEEYAHVQQVWNTFEMETLGDLHDLYVATDVLLLADVIEQYRKMCWDRMGLEALTYISLPSLTFDACLKTTKTRLQIVKDIDLLQMLESGIRGGISVISHRHAVANNPLLKEFNPSVPESHLLYIDANNLYGYAMSEKMPIDEIKFVDESTVARWTKEDIMRMDVDGCYSYILEVDIEIPQSIHDRTSDYPLCPDRLEITKDMISPKSREIRVQRGSDKDFKSIKLAPSLFSKEAYVTHLRNLQFYLSQGAVLTKVRRAIHYRQEAWIAPYIAENTRLRQQAADDFEKDYYKLLNNAFFGKTMENVRKRTRIVLVNSGRSHAWQTSKPAFKRFNIFNENLVGVELAQSNITLSKPIYVGFTVLELSKLLMYKFHYKVMKPNFPTSVLCFTDTDSFLYHIECRNLYSEHLNRLKEHFDFSNYPENHHLFSNTNRAVVGKFKDETSGIPIREFIGLRSKCYSILTAGGKQKNTAAGVKKSVRDKELYHQLYRNILYDVTENGDHYIHQKTFRSNNHTIYTIDQCKVGLTRYDDKRWILSDGITTRPHGHYQNSLDN